MPDSNTHLYKGKQNRDVSKINAVYLWRKTDINMIRNTLLTLALGMSLGVQAQKMWEQSFVLLSIFHCC